MLIINEEGFVGKGNERVCYVHPDDANKAVKISYDQSEGRTKQTTTEVGCYKRLLRRKSMSWKHLPRYYGEVETNKGKGFIVELVRDFDGGISKSLEHYVRQNGVEAYRKELCAYRRYLLDNGVIFNYGMRPKNILLRKNSQTECDLVLIDGLGDVSFFTVLNLIPYFARAKINRRWDRFVRKYLNGNSESKECGGLFVTATE